VLERILPSFVLEEGGKKGIFLYSKKETIATDKIMATIFNTFIIVSFLISIF